MQEKQTAHQAAQSNNNESKKKKKVLKQTDDRVMNYIPDKILYLLLPVYL